MSSARSLKAEAEQAHEERAARALPEPAGADVRIYWHASRGWQVEWLTEQPNGGQSNYYVAARGERAAEPVAPTDRTRFFGGCTCAGPDGPCESCVVNREAHEQWLAEQSDAELRALIWQMPAIEWTPGVQSRFEESVLKIMRAVIALACASQPAEADRKARASLSAELAQLFKDFEHVVDEHDGQELRDRLAGLVARHA